MNFLCLNTAEAVDFSIHMREEGKAISMPYGLNTAEAVDFSIPMTAQPLPLR